MTLRRGQVLSASFLGFLILILLGAVWAATQAETAILQSQAGQVTEFPSDPSSPGFRAFTTATETALVLHTAVTAEAGAELVGVSLLTGADGNAGGSVVTIPRNFIDAEQTGLTLADLFRVSGLSAVISELNGSLRTGFGDVVVLDASSWTGLMVDDLPLTLTLRDDLVRPLDASGIPNAPTEVVLEAGTRGFDLNEIATIAGHRNPSEPALGVALRQQQIWRAWISRTAGDSERTEVLGQERSFASLVGDLSNAEVSYRTIGTRTSPAQFPEDTVYVAQNEMILDLVAQIVPFPEQIPAIGRPTVLLLDNSLGASSQLPVISSITRSGGSVTVLGNTDGVTAQPLEVQVHDPLAQAVAEEIAQRLGYGPPRMVALEDATTAITVVTG